VEQQEEDGTLKWQSRLDKARVPLRLRIAAAAGMYCRVYVPGEPREGYMYSITQSDNSRPILASLFMIIEKFAPHEARRTEHGALQDTLPRHPRHQSKTRIDDHRLLAIKASLSGECTSDKHRFVLERKLALRSRHELVAECRQLSKPKSP